jgi:hypothetical protein
MGEVIFYRRINWIAKVDGKKLRTEGSRLK